MPVENIPTTYLGLFISLMLGMWGLIVLMVRAMLSNQRDTASNIQVFGKETAAHMAASNELLRSIVADQARVEARTSQILPSYSQMVQDTQDIKSRLLDVIVELAKQGRAAEAAAFAAAAADRNAVQRPADEPSK